MVLGRIYTSKTLKGLRTSPHWQRSVHRRSDL